MTERPATTIPVPSSTVPELGQVVEVRRRQWIGAFVVPDDLPKQNLARLASINEDGLGVEIEVLCEPEPGAHIIEHAGAWARMTAGTPRADVLAVTNITDG